MSRMYGGWYLIATRRNAFEKHLVGPYDVYTRRPDGDIREDFYVRTRSFHAPLKHFVLHDWVRPGTNNAHWRVQVLWPINLPFLVLYVDPNYRYALFGEDSRKLGWIYSRTPIVPESDYQDMLARFRSLGYDTSTFVRFVQKPEQIGKPGFWSDGITTLDDHGASASIYPNRSAIVGLFDPYAGKPGPSRGISSAMMHACSGASPWGLMGVGA